MPTTGHPVRAAGFAAPQHRRGPTGAEAAPRPTFSVVLTTYNRADLLPVSIASVLSQTEGDFELIVVDDGSTDTSPDVVSSFTDRRLRYLRQSNAGLSRARNAGIAAAQGEWVTFLDDDDEALPEWLAQFAGCVRDRVGIVCCAARFPDRVVEPTHLGPLFDNQTGLFMAGTFCVRRALLDDVGGYLPELRCSHQTELALRLVPHCVERGWEIVWTTLPGVRVTRREAVDRPIRNPEALLSATLLIVARHEARLRRDPRAHGLYLGIAGVNAARLGQFALARRIFRQAVRCHRDGMLPLLRLAVAHVPPLARRVWRTGEFARMRAAPGENEA